MRPEPTKAALRLLHEGALAFAEMEHAGMAVDLPLLDRRTEEARREVDRAAEELKKDEVWAHWQRRYRNKANLGSTQQLGEVLYGVMGLEPAARTPSGLPATDEKSLLATGLTFCQKYIARKKMEKVKGTYLDGIRKFVCPDGRLRPSYHLHKTISYRSGCSEPNGQNFPKRNKSLGKLVRECIVPSRGCRIVDADFSILEVRTMACLNKDPKLIEYILDPTTDMHRDTAQELFFLDDAFVKVNHKWVKDTVRSETKNKFVFPEFYGGTWFQCAPALWKAASAITLPDGTPLHDHLRRHGIKHPCRCVVREQKTGKGKIKEVHERPKPGTFCDHVREVEESFWNDRFEVYTQWKKDWWAAYQEKGYYHSYTGFVYEWGGDDAGGATRLPSKNDALNHANQGQASHCGVQVIVWLNGWLKKNKMQAKIIGFIHDAVMVDCPEGELQEVISQLYFLMTRRLNREWDWLIVPLEAEVEVSGLDGNWWDLSVWTEEGGTWGPKTK